MASLLILLLALVLVVVPLWVIVRIVSLSTKNEALERRLHELEWEVRALRDKHLPPTPPPIEAPRPADSSVPSAQRPPPVITRTPAPAVPASAVPEPALIESRPAPAMSPPATPALPPTLPLRPSTAEPPPHRRINWEHFTGAKLLAWAGGFTAFLGAAFFIKYSFEHDLIPPSVRVALGYLFAAGLVVGGLLVPRARYAVTAQTLCATGIVCLYAVTFACNAIYAFPFFRAWPTFLLMALITAGAFGLAVRLQAQVVAVLGLVGGFITPVLLSTGRDNVFGLFGYVGLLDVGLVALALRQRWFFLVPLGAAGTVAMQLGWAAKFLNAAKVPTAMLISLVFCALFLGAFLAARRWALAGPRSADTNTDAPGSIPRVPPPIAWSALAFPCVAFAFALAFFGYPEVANRPGLLFAFVFAANACLLVLAWLERQTASAHLIGGLATFGLLAVWTATRLTPELLGWALGLYVAHGALHASFPLLMARRAPGATPPWWSQLFPLLAIVLMLGPLVRLDAISFAFWPCMLLLDLIVIGLAVFTGSVAAMIVALALTLISSGLWLLRMPATTAEPGLLLVVVSVVAVLFVAAGTYLARRLSTSAEHGARAGAAAQLPALSALLPFLLLVMICQRLPLASPTGVFAVALLLVSLLLVLARLLAVPWLPLWALGATATVEYAWHGAHFSSGAAVLPLLWYAAFYVVFGAYPFVFRRDFAGTTGPWAAAALAGVAHFPLVYDLVRRTWPNDLMGVIPAVFALLPAASFAAVQRSAPADGRARMGQLAWFGGVTLLFVTLVFPIQFERQWITLGWALEGAALLWLFRRVPHPGLRAVGGVLLIAAFVRLALNPAVFEYQVRSGAPVFNWYLYTYGLVTACLFAGARWLQPPHDRAAGISLRPLLATLGVVLAFLLVNIEIADFFTAPGARFLTFDFSGNFARDMTYTIAWALFALGLLLASIWKHTRAGRYAALGLLGLALLKLFFHDLQRLGALHRIGALFAVALIAIVASVLYQRFLPAHDRESSPSER